MAVVIGCRGNCICRKLVVASISRKIVCDCSGCQKMTEKSEAGTSTCSECGAELEDLEGFYTRHPEKRP